jgi:fermentation-respiration switch protein FrsA (DUF1100 family)
MAESVFPMFKLIPTIKNSLLRLKWESDKHVPTITTPMFFISGDADTFVPTEQTWQLYNAAGRSIWKECWIVPGGNHNNTFQMAGPMYFTKCQQFMDRCLRKDFKTPLEAKKD